jgi:hypothetical protein
MKLLTLTLLVSAILSAGSPAFAGCGAGACCDPSKSSEKRVEASSQIYNCEMHPEVTSDKPGKCPTCGMTLSIKKDEAKKS